MTQRFLLGAVPWSATGHPKTDPDAQIATALLKGTTILKPDEVADREVGHSVKYITLEDDWYDYTWAASWEGSHKKQASIVFMLLQ